MRKLVSFVMLLLISAAAMAQNGENTRSMCMKNQAM